MDNINFIEFLQNNENKSDIRKFIIDNGKEGKPFCPVIFIKKDGDKDDN